MVQNADNENESFTILVVEDNPEEVFLLQKALKQTGMEIVTHFASDGEEAIDYLSGTDQFRDRFTYPEPDLLLMDLKMPRKGGFELLEWFRNLQEGALIPVVVLTSSTNEADVQRAYSLGANSYFLKPTSFNEFRETVKAICQYWLRARRPKPLAAKH